MNWDECLKVPDTYSRKAWDGRPIYVVGENGLVAVCSHREIREGTTVSFGKPEAKDQKANDWYRVEHKDVKD